MQGDKVQLKQISCAITSMSKGYQGEGKFKGEDTGMKESTISFLFTTYFILVLLNFFIPVEITGFIMMIGFLVISCLPTGQFNKELVILVGTN